MRRVVYNQKGGVGKSSIAVNLAAIHAARGFSTLLVDLDPQSNTSQYVLGHDIQPDHHLGEFFEQFLGFSLLNWPAKRFLYETPFANLTVMAAHASMAEQHNRLESKHKIYKLREALDSLAGRFDAVYIDTPPASNFFSLSALIAADRCLVPFDCDVFSRQALYRLVQEVEEIKADHNQQLQIEGIVVNQFRSRARLPQQLIQELESESVPVFKTRLSSSVVMQESHQRHQPLIYCASNHKLTKQFESLYTELESA